MILKQNKYYAVETLDDPDSRMYHSRVRLLDQGLQVVSAYKGCDKYDFGHGPTELPAVLSTVLEFPGVASATLRAYHVVVNRSPVYDWDEIEKPMLALLEGVSEAVDVTQVIEQVRDMFNNQQAVPIMPNWTEAKE